MRELSFENATESIKVSIFATNSPSKWMGRDREKNVIGREKSSFAYFRINNVKCHFFVVNLCWDDLGGISSGSGL